MARRKGEKDGGKPAIPEKYYAHSLPGSPPEEWQPLEEHLKNVGEIAK